MESHKRTELVEALLEETRQMITVLLTASTAPDVSPDMSQSAALGTPPAQAQYNIQHERQCWEGVFKNLTDVQNALGQIAQSERHRGVGA